MESKNGRLVESWLERPLAFVDVETTGFSAGGSRVLEIGVVRVERGRVAATFQSLVQPDTAVPAAITRLTGITNGDVTAAPRFEQVADKVIGLLAGAIFVAHNVGFDASFVRMEYDRLGREFRPPQLCTVRLSRRLYPDAGRHKLEDLIRRHNLAAPSRHRAYDDAVCLWQFWQLCLAEFGPQTMEAAMQAQLVMRL